MCGVILRSLRRSSLATLVSAFNIYARPHLEFASPLFNGTRKTDSKALERVQRTFTRRLFSRFRLPAAEYPDRLEKLGLLSLAERRDNLDIGFLKSVSRGTHFCPEISFANTSAPYRLRGHTRLIPERNATGVRRHFFVNRLANRWNAMSHRRPKVGPKTAP